MISKVIGTYNFVLRTFNKIEKKWDDLHDLDHAEIEEIIKDLEIAIIKKLYKKYKKKIHEFNEIAFQIIKLKHDELKSNIEKLNSLNDIIQDATEKKQDKIIKYCNYLILKYHFLYSPSQIEQLLKFLKLNPQSYIEWINLGLIYYKLENYDYAIKAYINALNINPEYELAKFYLSMAYYDNQNFNEALEIFRQLQNESVNLNFSIDNIEAIKNSIIEKYEKKYIF